MSHTKLFSLLNRDASTAASCQEYVNKLLASKNGHLEITRTAEEIAAIEDKADRRSKRNVLFMRLRRAENGPHTVKRMKQPDGSRVFAIVRVERRKPDPKASLERACALVQANASHPLVRAMLAALGAPQPPRAGRAPAVRVPGARQQARQPMAPELRSH